RHRRGATRRPGHVQPVARRRRPGGVRLPGCVAPRGDPADGATSLVHRGAVRSLRCAQLCRPARWARPPGGQRMSALPAAADITITSWTGTELSQRVNEAMAIYVVAMNSPTYAGAQRSLPAQGHPGSDGFACRAALRPDGRLVGFAYGYTSRPGQWWHDLVRRAVTNELAAEW